MNSSLRSAGRTTHLKIVALSLTFAIVVVLVGFNARIIPANTEAANAVVKAGKPAKYAGQESSSIR